MTTTITIPLGLLASVTAALCICLLILLLLGYKYILEKYADIFCEGNDNEDEL